MNWHTWTSRARHLAVSLLLLGAAAPASADEPKVEAIVVGTPAKVEVFPTSIKLDGPGREMHLIVTGHYADGATQDLTTVAQVTSKDDKIARAEHGVVLPTANGQTEVTVTVGGHTVGVPVEVSKQEAEDKVSFNYGTLAVLSKQGCNSGACHGSRLGSGLG